MKLFLPNGAIIRVLKKHSDLAIRKYFEYQARNSNNWSKDIWNNSVLKDQMTEDIIAYHIKLRDSYSDLSKRNNVEQYYNYIWSSNTRLNVQMRGPQVNLNQNFLRLIRIAFFLIRF